MTETQTDQPTDETTEQPTEATTDEPEVKVGEPTYEGIEPSSELVRFTASGHGLLSIDPDQEKWSPTQRIALRAIGIETEGADAVPPAYVAQFLHVAQSADLDPWRREAYLVTYGKRWVKSDGTVVDNRRHSLITGIDGFRKKAEDTGEYAGQVGPEWLKDSGEWVDYWMPKWGAPEAARVGILRRGFDVPVYGVALFNEFCPLVDEYTGYGRSREKTGKRIPTAMWLQMPANQIAKCAEAQGLRKAFPRQFSGMYAPEEMDRARAEHDESEKRLADQRRREAMMAKQRRRESVPSQREPAPVEADPQDPAAGPRSTAPSDQDDPPTEQPQPVAGEAAEVVAEAAVSHAAAPEDEQRAWLLAELEYQAKVLDQTVARLTLRQARATRKNLDAFTAQDLAAVTLSLRDAVVNTLGQQGQQEQAEAYSALGSQVVDVVGLLVPVGEVVGEDEQ